MGNNNSSLPSNPQLLLRLSKPDEIFNICAELTRSNSTVRYISTPQHPDLVHHDDSMLVWVDDSIALRAAINAQFYPSLSPFPYVAPGKRRVALNTDATYHDMLEKKQIMQNAGTIVTAHTPPVSGSPHILVLIS